MSHIASCGIVLSIHERREIITHRSKISPVKGGGLFICYTVVMESLKYVFVIVVIGLLGLVWFRYEKTDVAKDQGVVVSPTENPVVTPNQPRSLCFAFHQKGSNGMEDKDLLRLDLNGSDVSGELKFLPAEKDMKTGTFTGTVSKVDPKGMSRTIDAWWDTHAEGMNTKEQLSIIFGEGTANVGFGEMKDRGDGVYVYAHPEKISYSLSLTDVACEDLNK